MFKTHFSGQNMWGGAKIFGGVQPPNAPLCLWSWSMSVGRGRVGPWSPWHFPI